jgi:hypothetical protein
VIGIRGKPYSAGEKTSNKFDKFLADTAGFVFRFFDAIEKKVELAFRGSLSNCFYCLFFRSAGMRNEGTFNFVPPPG